MILGLMGTNPYSFDRLAEALDNLGMNTDLEVFVQRGHTNFDFKHCRTIDFLPNHELITLMDNSRLVISHGGYGSISEAILRKKPIIVVPRYPCYGESKDNQEETVIEFEKKGYVYACYHELHQLPKIVEQALKRTRPKKCVHVASLPPLIADQVRDFIDSL